ncbi:MAG: NADH-quinone oxidoreductase subunit N, partial [Deltaproteobacteria bacterium]|nr:NADH-quinone oxidoreductase subunit N [Deltaproteobacteria bacterium]
PVLAAIMTVFMLALTGIPPTVGFAGKFFIFREAVHQGLYPLVIVGVLMSAVSAYYYLRVIVTMYFGKSENSPLPPIRWSTATTVVILFCVVSVFYMGFCPTRYVELSKMSTLKPQNLSFLAK